MLSPYGCADLGSSESATSRSQATLELVPPDCTGSDCLDPSGDDLAPAAASFAALPAYELYELGPDLGGRLDGIIVSATGDILVASPGGGVWRHQFDSADWVQPANRGLADYTVVHLEQDVIDPNVIYAVAWNGVYRTTNLGDDWTRLVGSPLRDGVATNSNALPEQGSVVDPKPFAQLRFSQNRRVLLWGRPCDGLWWSFDGDTWDSTRVPGTQPQDQCIGNIAADPETGVVYFSTMTASVMLGRRQPQVFRSVLPWSPGLPVRRFEPIPIPWLPHGPEAVASLAAASVPGSAEPRMVALLRDDSLLQTWVGTEDSRRRFRWELASQQESSLPDPTYSPRPLLYSGFGEEMLHGNVVPYQQLAFHDGWNNFAPLAGPVLHADVRAMFHRPGTHELLLATDGAFNTGTGVNIAVWPYEPGTALDPDDMFEFPIQGLRVWQVYTTAIAPVSGGPQRRLFAGTQDNSALCFEDASPGTGYTHLGAPTAGGDIHELVVDPYRPNRAYELGNTPVFARSVTADSAGGCQSVAWEIRGNDPGEEPLPCGRSEWDASQLAVHPDHEGFLYLACDSGLLGVGFSPDAGDSWQVRPVVDRDSPDRRQLSVSAVHVDRGGYLFTGVTIEGEPPGVRGGTFISADGGMSWRRFGLNDGSHDRVLAIDAEYGGVSYAATTRGLYRRPAFCGAGGECWRRVLPRSGPPSLHVVDVEADPLDRCRVYAAFGNWAERQHSAGGLWLSLDGGRAWRELTLASELRRVPIQDIEIDPTDGGLVSIGTFGRGVWTLEWPNGAPPCE